MYYLCYLDFWFHFYSLHTGQFLYRMKLLIKIFLILFKVLFYVSSHCCSYHIFNFNFGNLYKRLKPKSIANKFMQIITLGYAIPGPVIAIAVMIPFSNFDNYLNQILQSYFGISVGLLFSGTFFIFNFRILYKIFDSFIENN